MGRLIVKIVDSQLKFDSKLVRLVKQYEYIFDVNHILFNDGKTKIETWKLIANQLGKSEMYCEKRWVFLLHRYYDEIIWMTKYGGTSLWLLFHQLAFLKTFIDWNYIFNVLPAFNSELLLEGV